MILSKAAFFHKKYLSMYTYEMPSSIREYVTKNRFFSICYLHSYLSCLVLILSCCLLSFPIIKYFFNHYACTRNCEDIAMSFLVANATGAPPIWAKGMLICSVNLISSIKIYIAQVWFLFIWSLYLYQLGSENFTSLNHPFSIISFPLSFLLS